MANIWFVNIIRDPGRISRNSIREVRAGDKRTPRIDIKDKGKVIIEINHEMYHII